MAKSSKKMFLSLALVFLSIALILTGAQSRTTPHSAVDGSSLSCSTVIGVEGGDTCTAIANAFGLTIEEFSAINPNLDCDGLFVGQWLCVQGS